MHINLMRIIKIFKFISHLNKTITFVVYISDLKKRSNVRKPILEFLRLWLSGLLGPFPPLGPFLTQVGRLANCMLCHPYFRS